MRDMKTTVGIVMGAMLAVIAGGVRADRLPGFRELAYVESTGRQWVDTGIATTGRTAIELDFTVTGDNGNHAYFCGDWANGGHLLVINGVMPISFCDFEILPGTGSVDSTDTLDIVSATLRTEGRGARQDAEERRTDVGAGDEARRAGRAEVRKPRGRDRSEGFRLVSEPVPKT